MKMIKKYLMRLLSAVIPFNADYNVAPVNYTSQVSAHTLICGIRRAKRRGTL